MLQAPVGVTIASETREDMEETIRILRSAGALPKVLIEPKSTIDPHSGQRVFRCTLGLYPVVHHNRLTVIEGGRALESSAQP